MKIFRSKIWFYGFVLTGFAFVLALSLFALLKLPLLVLLIDSLVFTLVSIFVSLLLQSALQFSKPELLPITLRIFNYIILSLFSLGITIGVVYLIEIWIFDESTKVIFFTLIPLKSMLFVMICLIIAKFGNKQTDESNAIEEYHETSEQAVEPIDKTTIERFAIKSGTKIHLVPVAEIIYLMADGDYVQVVTEKGKFLKEQTMKYFETNLPENQFIRVHRSHIVNVDFISRIELFEKQNQQLTLKNGHKIKVSQQGYKILRQKLKL